MMTNMSVHQEDTAALSTNVPGSKALKCTEQNLPALEELREKSTVRAGYSEAPCSLAAEQEKKTREGRADMGSRGTHTSRHLQNSAPTVGRTHHPPCHKPSLNKLQKIQIVAFSMTTNAWRPNSATEGHLKGLSVWNTLLNNPHVKEQVEKYRMRMCLAFGGQWTQLERRRPHFHLPNQNSSSKQAGRNQQSPDNQEEENPVNPEDASQTSVNLLRL